MASEEWFILTIRQKFADGLVEFTQHATDRSILRHISLGEIEQAIASGEIIEYYPDDKYGPSCLIFGYTLERRPLHIQCSYPIRPLLKVISVYQPDPKLWIDFRTRRSTNGL
ncbi:MAG: DUF4258 domain-containing protein [Chloroflexota bacterium]|nr:DUF4258 domain-containing protein [Chloroflexota bacterium]